jgi:hypothetical protein
MHIQQRSSYWGRGGETLKVLILLHVPSRGTNSNTFKKWRVKFIVINLFIKDDVFTWHRLERKIYVTKDSVYQLQHAEDMTSCLEIKITHSLIDAYMSQYDTNILQKKELKMYFNSNVYWLKYEACELCKWRWYTNHTCYWKLINIIL